MNSLQKKILFYAVMLAGSALIGYSIYNTHRQQVDSEQQVEHSRQVIAECGKVLVLSKDAVIASRDFIITGNTELLGPLYKAEKISTGYIDQLRLLTINNQPQQQKLDSLSFHFSRLIDFSLQEVALRRSPAFNLEMVFKFTGAGIYEMAKIQKAIGEIEVAETALLEQRKYLNKRNEKTSNWFLAIISIMTGVLTISFFLVVDKHRMQKGENESRVEQLEIRNEELADQNARKEKHALELNLANQALIKSNEKERRAEELVFANKELAYQSEEKEKRAAELIIANRELIYQSNEKERRADELVLANQELAHQSEEKEKRAAELIIANQELAYQSEEKGKRAAELIIANQELIYQSDEKERRADELVLANQELAYQSEEKEKRAGELIIANQVLIFQNTEKEKRAAELVIANKELAHQNAEKEKSKIELKFANVELEKTKSELQQIVKGIKKIMDASYDVICSFDENGKFINVSAASEWIWGYLSDELTGSDFTDIVFDEDVKKTEIVLSAVMSGLPATAFENRCIHKNGNLVSMLWSVKWDGIDQLNYCIGKDISEKKILENAFDQQRQRIYDMFTNAPSNIGILMGPDHIYEMVNPSYLKLIGKKDIIGKPVREVLPEVVDQGLITILDNVYNTGQPFTANELLVQLDNKNTGLLTDVFLNIIYQAFFNKFGIIEGIFFFSVDVTEQVLSRKKIAESENQYRRIVETAQEGIWLIDKNGETRFVNKKLCEILGYGAGEIIGKAFASFVSPDDEEIKMVPFGRNKSKTNEKRVLSMFTKEGKKIWVSLAGAPLLDASGRKDGRLEMVTDITEKRIVAQRLESTKARLQEEQAIAHVGSWEIDLADHMHYWSDEMYRNFGINRCDVVACEKEFMSFFHPDDLKIAYEKMDVGFKTQQNITFDFRFIRRDGVTRYGYNESKFIFDQAGKPIKVLGIFQDITERKLAEQERLKIIADLLLRNKILEQFTYIVSHNLRSPVANIIGVSNILNSPGLPIEKRDVLGKLLSDSVLKLDDVIKDLHDILQAGFK